MTKPTNSLIGLCTYGSPGYSVSQATGEYSAVAQAAADFTQLVIADTSIASFPLNEATAKQYGIEIRQGVTVQVPLEDDKQAILTLFPVIPQVSHTLLLKFSAKYPRVPINPLEYLPFGTDAPKSLVPQVPIEEIRKHKNSFLICNSTLGGNTAIPYNEELTDLYQCLFVRFDGMYRVSAEEIRRLKKLHPNIMILPHYHTGGLTNEKALTAVQEILSPRMFPVPHSMETISIQEAQELYGLFTSCDEFFMRTPRLNMLSDVLLPGAKLSTEYGFPTVEIVPEALRPTDEQRRVLLSKLRNVCMSKLQERYDGENLEYGIAMVEGELKSLYEGQYHGFLLAHTLHSLYEILCETDRECCILVKYHHQCPAICWLLGLSRYDPIIHEPEGSVHVDIVTSMNFLELETSAATYCLIRDKLKDMFPLRIAEVAEDLTLKKYLEESPSTCHIHAMQELDYAERQRMMEAVIAFRPSGNCHHSILIAPEGTYLPAILLGNDSTSFPHVVPAFWNMVSASTFNLSIHVSETLDRFERVNEAVSKKHNLRITKTVEKRLFEEFLPQIDRVMAAGILELGSSFIRKQIRDRKPRNRQELASIFREYFLDGYGDYFLNITYHLQLVDVMLHMLLASLSHPQEYFVSVDIGDHDLAEYPDEVLERIVYEGGAVNGQVDEYTERLLIDNDIPAEHYIQESVNKDRPLLEYAKRKRFYPMLII